MLTLHESHPNHTRNCTCAHMPLAVQHSAGYACSGYACSNTNCISQSLKMQIKTNGSCQQLEQLSLSLCCCPETARWEAPDLQNLNPPVHPQTCLGSLPRTAVANGRNPHLHLSRMVSSHVLRLLDMLAANSKSNSDELDGVQERIACIQDHVTQSRDMTKIQACSRHVHTTKCKGTEQL